MTLNHWVVGSSPTGVTKGSINPQKSSENHWFSELFLFTPIPDWRKILKLRVCKKGAEVVGFKEDGQWSHTFTNQDSTMRLTLGVNTVDGWGDMVTAGIAMVRKYIESLATDAKTKTLVQTVLRLLSTDKQGNLNASRVLQLQKLADESDDDQFKEGVKIIRESYQPTATRRYIRAQYRDKGTGAWRNIPLGITDVDLLTEEEKAPEATAEADETEAKAEP